MITIIVILAVYLLIGYLMTLIPYSKQQIKASIKEVQVSVMLKNGKIVSEKRIENLLIFYATTRWGLFLIIFIFKKIFRIK